MRSEEHVAILMKMTPTEKAKITSYESFLKRKNIVKKYQYRHLVVNEYPNNVAETERVLFYRARNNYPNNIARGEYGDIRKEHFDFTTKDMSVKGRSVTGRYHIHFIN